MHGRNKLIIPQEELSIPEYSYELPQERLPEVTAPISRRAFAFIIDILVFNMIFYPLFMNVFQTVSGLRNQLLTPDYIIIHPEILTVMFGVITASSVILCFYMGLSEYALGATLGKQFMNIHVEGSANLWGYIARNFLKSTLIIFLPIDLIGLLLYNQRFIDKALGINVLYKKSIKLSEGFV